MAPKERSISPTTMTSVRPSDMIATELIARSTEMPTSMLKEFGLRMNMNKATSDDGQEKPAHAQSATSKVALAGRREAGARRVDRRGLRDSALVIARSAN